LNTKKPLKYLFVGGWNTLFGYFATIAMYYLFSPALHIVAIAVLTNILTITMSFTTYKLFVFQTKGNWLKEYGKSYIVYGFAALLSIIGLWLFVEVFNINIWIAQALTMVFIVVISYIGHDRFTFKGNSGSDLAVAK